jgi:hypothetical protein
MRDDDDGQLTLKLESVQDRTNFNVMLKIQKSGRLIEQKYFRILCKGSSDNHTLALPSGQSGDCASGNVPHVHCHHRPLRDGTIF